MRERLIGAIVLVVIAVILIPWLVSRARHPEDVVTHKPWPASASTPQQPYVLPLQATRTVAARKTPAQQTSSTTATPSRAATQLPAQPVTHAASGVAPASAPPPPPGHDAAVSGSDSNKAPEIKQGTASGGWSVQAASFSDLNSARALADKLEQAGFMVGLNSHKVKGTLYYQVLVGPYPSEKLAQDAAPGVARISNTKVLVRAPGSGKG